MDMNYDNKIAIDEIANDDDSSLADRIVSISIDKISMTYSFADRNRLAMSAYAIDHLLSYVDSGKLPGATISDSRFHQYEVVVAPYAGNTGDWPSTIHILLGAKGDSKRADIRIECNPSKLGVDGIRFLKELIDSIMPPDADPFFDAGIVTRIDIAIDYWSVELDDLVIRDRGMRKHGIYSGGRGEVQTLYYGTPKANRTIVYRKTLGDGAEWCRFEKHRKKRDTLASLASLANPFSRLQVIHKDSIRPILTGIHADMFMDSIRVRGLTHALKMLDPRMARAIDRALKLSKNACLKSTDEIWEQWPDLYQRYLAPLLNASKRTEWK
jgi:hypothetical protein